MTDDPLALRNIPGGLAFLRRYHKNKQHPLHTQEQADTQAWLRARQPAPQPVAAPAAPRTKRLKKEPPRPDSDGVYRL